jgi:inosine/xanthosine triphosphate pyrophosphatase family protein
LVEDLTQTMAELSREQKNLVSHRARAVRLAAHFLTSDDGAEWLGAR